jgi:hypothetical protein
MAIVGEDNPIRLLIWMLVVLGRRPDETKVHKQFNAALWDLFGGALGHLFMDVCLFFEVNGTERVVLENRWSANYMLREDPVGSPLGIQSVVPILLIQVDGLC